MSTKLNNLKSALTAAAEDAGKNLHARKFLVDICAGYGLAHYKLVCDIEGLETAVDNVGSDIDFAPRVAEAIKHLPTVSENYYNSLVRLGVVEVSAPVEPANKTAKVATDDDALAELQRKVAG